MAKFTEEELEMLTEDERRAIEELGDEYDDDNEDPPMDPDDDEAGDDDDSGDDGDDDDAADDPDKEAAAKPEGDEGAEGDDGQEGEGKESEGEPAPKEAAEEQITPPLNVDYPEDYENKLKDFEEQRTRLDVDFDDGELTSQEYRQQLREIESQEQEIRDQVLKAQIAQEWQENQQRQAWTNTVNTFLDENDVYRQSRALYRELNDTVIEIANSKEAEGMTGQKILEEAHKRVSSDPALASVFKDKAPQAEAESDEKSKKEGKPPLKPRNVPPTLANVPASDTTTADEGSRFGKLDRMDGLELEAELERLSNTNPAMVEEYLSR